MKRNWIIFSVATCLLAACSQMTQEERFLKIAENENLKCPKRLNSTTVFDSTHYDAMNNCVSYYYTLSGKADDAEKYKKNYNNFRNALDQTIINSLEMKAYLDYKTTIKYIYYSDSTQTILAEFVFNED